MAKGRPSKVILKALSSGGAWAIDLGALLGSWLLVDWLSRGVWGIQPRVAHLVAFPICTALSGLWVTLRAIPRLTWIAGQKALRQELAVSRLPAKEFLGPVVSDLYLRGLLPFLPVIFHPMLTRHEYSWMGNLVNIDVASLALLVLDPIVCISSSLALFALLLRGGLNQAGFLAAQILLWAGIQILVFGGTLVVVTALLNLSGALLTEQYVVPGAVIVASFLVGGLLLTGAWRAVCKNFYVFE